MAKQAPDTDKGRDNDTSLRRHQQLVDFYLTFIT